MNKRLSVATCANQDPLQATTGDFQYNFSLVLYTFVGICYLYISGQELMALSKTESSSLARRQIYADLLQSITKQRVPLERPSKVAAGAVFRCDIAGQIIA